MAGLGALGRDCAPPMLAAREEGKPEVCLCDLRVLPRGQTRKGVEQSLDEEVGSAEGRPCVLPPVSRRRCLSDRPWPYVLFVVCDSADAGEEVKQKAPFPGLRREPRCGRAMHAHPLTQAPTRTSFSTAHRQRLKRLSHLGQTLQPRVPGLPQPASLEGAGQWPVCHAEASPTEDPASSVWCPAQRLVKLRCVELASLSACGGVCYPSSARISSRR